MTRRIVFALVLLILTVGSVFGQMDMLPQIFRDLPPELQDGLPEEMTFAEYRQLNRNVDFFTMFMSMFMPGYGLFQVEKPALAWTAVGARLAGYGMMATAVALEWNNFYDLFHQPELSVDDFDRFKNSMLLFSSGVVVGGLSWAADVMLAYHIAKQEKDLVTYIYGVRNTITRSSYGADQASQEERYLRGLLEQPGDRSVRRILLAQLPRYALLYPETPFAQDALYFQALLLAEEENDLAAFGYAARTIARYPESPRAYDAIQLAARLIERNRRSWGAVMTLTQIPSAASPPDERVFKVIEAFSQCETGMLDELTLQEGSAFLKAFKTSPRAPYVMKIMATILAGRRDYPEAVGYLSASVVAWPESEIWAASALQLAELYLEPLGDGRRAVVLARAILEHRPDGPEAVRAAEIVEGD